MNRSLLREITFKLLYELEVQKEERIEQVDLYIENNEIKDEKSIKYIREVTSGINSENQKIEDLISMNLKKDWTLDRISKVNLAILKLAIYEINYMDLPYKVGINEAVELAKKYGDESAKNFVNGVLASIVSEKAKEDEKNKDDNKAENKDNEEENT